MFDRRIAILTACVVLSGAAAATAEAAVQLSVHYQTTSDRIADSEVAFPLMVLDRPTHTRSIDGPRVEFAYPFSPRIEFFGGAARGTAARVETWAARFPSHEEGTLPPPPTVDVRVRTTFVNAVVGVAGTFDPTERVTVLLRGGALLSRNTLSVDGVTVRDSDARPLVGIGARVALAGPWSLSMTYDVATDDYRSGAVGLIWSF